MQRRKYKQRKYFTTGELKLMKNLASNNQSQSEAAKLLDRDVKTIYQAARRYEIYFHATPGPKKSLPVIRFDDPRVMIGN